MIKIPSNFKKAFLDEFSSLRLAITLFVFLAITTLIGTILPEEPMVGHTEIIKKYGIEKYELLKSLGLTDVFHSWWYLALLTAMGLNLTIASFIRVFPKARLAFKWPTPLTPEKILKLQINSELPASDELSIQILENELKKRNFKIKSNDINLIAVKGRWHKLGASVTHIGILTLLVGSAISILTGFNGMAQISEKEGFYIANLIDKTNQIKSSEPGNWIVPITKMPIWFGHVPDYLIKVNKTWRENYKTGQPKQWFSDISVYNQDKKEIARKTIFVNSPLEFRGLDIYQSNWGKFIEVDLNGEVITLPLENFREEEVAVLPIGEDIGLKLKLADKEKNKSPNPVLEIYSIYFGKDKENVRGKLLATVASNQKIQLGPIEFGFLGTHTLTGLQFKSNPGDFLIFPGFIFIILGVFIAFGSKKQIWAAVSKIDNKIFIGGSADKSKGKFFQEFEDLVLDLVKNKTNK